MTDATIAVVVPSKDYGPFLGEALASLEHQSRPPDEVVVVDDGSTDQSASVGDVWLRTTGIAGAVIRHAHSLGPAGAFNAGIRATSTSLVCKLDGDDRLSPRYLELLSEAMRGGADFAYAGLRTFGAVETWRPPRPLDVTVMRHQNVVNGSALMTRALFESVGGFDPRFDRIGLEDWAFFVRALALGARGVPVEGCWVEYRRHQGGSRNDFSPLADLRAHLKVARLNPTMVRRADVARWFLRSTYNRVSRVWARS